jgi:hypothetical protein
MIWILVVMWLCAVAEPRTANAQPATASPEPGTERVEVEPVTCWWRTSATSVRVGEPFTVVLTCSLLQTEAARVIADESRLEPAVVQLPPFEVVGGARARDLTTAGRRFAQFEYRLRLIGESVFASEASLPPLEMTYRVESRVAGGDSLAGRDLTYALPRLTMRVLSLVPDTADEIREAPIATFADLETLRSRGNLLRVSASVLLALGVLMLALALLGAVRRRRVSRPAVERTLPGAAVLNGVRAELGSIREEVRSSGWTSELAGRAHAAVRIVAAYATGRRVIQRVSTTGNGIPQSATGELVVSSRRRAAAAISSAVVTSEDHEMRDALARFSAVRYGRQTTFDVQLDEALDAAVRRADRLAAQRPLLERLWPR